jgi:hypothetical protein
MLEGGNARAEKQNREDVSDRKLFRNADFCATLTFASSAPASLAARL